jgi:UrcA family protein
MLTKALTRTVSWAGTMLLAVQFHCAPVLADSALVARSVEVPIADLDLARPEDVRVLRRRIDRAARTACGPQPFLVAPDRAGYIGYQTCYVRTLKDAQLRIAALLGGARPIRESAKPVQLR